MMTYLEEVPPDEIPPEGVPEPPLEMDIIEQVKLLTESNNEPLIKLLVARAKKEIVTKLKVDEYKEDYNNVLVDIVIIKINRFGTEGLKSQNPGGTSETYLDDYPLFILEQLDAFKKKVHFV